MTVVPTIDLDGPAAAAIGRASETVGFFQIVGHGVDEAVIDEAWRTARAFFDLPLADRLAAAQRHPDDAYGYLPMEAEALERSMDEDRAAPSDTATAPDLKQTFNVGPRQTPAVDLDDPIAAWAFGATPWPSALPALEPAMRAYFDAMDDLARRLLRLFAVALDVTPDFFEPFVDLAPGALRALDYPDLGPDHRPVAGQLRAGAHTDYGTLTILRQDDAPGGLEVLDPRSGTWTHVPARPDAFVVNLGDLMQRWTNDRWRSTLHRVVVPDAGSGPNRRQSMAFFHNANVDARIEVIDTCVERGERPRYEPVIAGPHLMSKFRRATAG